MEGILRRVVHHWGAVLALGLCLGCGGDDKRHATGPAMGTVDPAAQARLAENRPPQIERLRLDPRSPMTGDTVVAEARVADPDGDHAWVEYEWFVDGNPVHRGGDGRLRLDRVAKGARLEVKAVPYDGRLQGEARTARTRIENRPPVVSSLELDQKLPILRGQVVAVVAEATDADPEDRDRLRLTYEWYVNDRAVGATDKSFDTGRLRRGDSLFVRVTPRDSEGAGEPRDSLAFSLDNLSPQIVSTPVGLGADGAFHYALEAEDPDGDRIFTWELVKAPEGMILDATTAEIRWTPGPDQAGTHEVEIHVIDAEGGRGGQAFPIVVSEQEPPAAESAVPAVPARY